MTELFNVAAGTEAPWVMALLRAFAVAILLVGFLSALHLVASVILSTRDRRVYAALAAGIVGAIIVEILLHLLSAQVARSFASEIQRNGNGDAHFWQIQTTATIMLLLVAMMPSRVISWFVGSGPVPPHAATSSPALHATAGDPLAKADATIASRRRTRPGTREPHREDDVQ